MSAVLVLVSVAPIDLLAEEGKETFQLRKELTCLTNLQEIARAKEAIRKDGRRRFVEKWQTRWHGDQSGRWTHCLIPELATWLDRKHSQVGFYLAQALQEKRRWVVPLLQIPCGQCWHDGLSHAPVWKKNGCLSSRSSSWRCVSSREGVFAIFSPHKKKKYIYIPARP